MLSQLCTGMEQGQLNGRRGSQENRRKVSVEEEEEGEVDKEPGLETPENENKEKLGEKSKPHKQRKKKEPGYTPEAREGEEEEGEEGLIFLPVSLELDDLRDWAVPGSQGGKGALVDVNNRKVLKF